MINKALLIFFSVFCFSAQIRAQDKPFIISGFDDVIRQAENTSLIRATIKFFETDKGFTGMPELYQVISQKEETPQFVIVSATATWLDQRISNFLLKLQFPSHKLYLRNWITQWSIQTFKTEKIKEIVYQRPNQKFLIILDNSEASIRLVDEIQNMFSKDLFTIYMRQVVNKNIPSNASGFYTAFDIASAEYTKGRISKDELYKVSQAILNEQNVELLFPSYAICPSTYGPCNDSDSDIKDICLKISLHVQNLCKQ